MRGESEATNADTSIRNIAAVNSTAVSNTRSVSPFSPRFAPRSLKFKLDHETYIKEEAKTRAKFDKAKPNLSRFLHSRFKGGKEDEHWDAIIAHMKSAGEYHEKLSKNMLCYELNDHSSRG